MFLQYSQLISVSVSLYIESSVIVCFCLQREAEEEPLPGDLQVRNGSSSCWHAGAQPAIQTRISSWAGGAARATPALKEGRYTDSLNDLISPP